MDNDRSHEWVDILKIMKQFLPLICFSLGGFFFGMCTMLHGMLKKAIYQPTKFEEMILKEKLRLASLPPIDKKNPYRAFIRSAIGLSALLILLLLTGCAGYYPNAGMGYARPINYRANVPPIPGYFGGWSPCQVEPERPINPPGSFYNPIYTAPYFGVQ